MSFKTNVVWSVLCFLSLTHLAAATVEPDGWLWYKDPKIEAPKKEDQTKPASPPETPQTPQTAVERLAVLQKHFEEVKAKAVLEPTLQNVAEARRVHNLIIKLASNFEESWMVAELLDPESQRLNTSPGALQVQKEQDLKELEHALKALSKTHGLLFVFSEGCPYCEGFAPLVIQFANTYGFEVEGLSSGSGCFDGMKCTQNGTAVRTINPTGEVPLLFLVNPQTKDVLPLAKGYVNWNDLLLNARHALTYLGAPS